MTAANGDTAAGGRARLPYIAAANTVCATAIKQLAAVPAAIGPQDLVTTLRAQLAVQQSTLHALTQLPSPPADRAAIADRLLQPFKIAIARQRALLPAVQAAIGSGDNVQFANLHTQYDQAGHPEAAAAFIKELGVHNCQSFEYFRTG